MIPIIAILGFILVGVGWFVLFLYLDTKMELGYYKTCLKDSSKRVAELEKQIIKTREIENLYREFDTADD